MHQADLELDLGLVTSSSRARDRPVTTPPRQAVFPPAWQGCRYLLGEWPEGKDERKYPQKPQLGLHTPPMPENTEWEQDPALFDST